MLLLFGSCKKVELPAPMIGEPVFTFSGEFNGNPRTFAGGVDSFYMYSSYEVDNDDIYTFIGQWGIEDNSNTDSQESLTISIRDQEMNPEDLFTDESLESSLLREDFTYASLDSIVDVEGFSINLINQSLSFVTDDLNHSWVLREINNPDNPLGISNEANTSFIVDALNNIEVCLTSSTPQNATEVISSATQCRTIQSFNNDCEISFFPEFTENKLTGIITEISNSNNSIFTWTTDSVFNGNNESEQFIDTTGTYCLFVIDANEESCTLCMDIDELGIFSDTLIIQPVFAVAKFAYEIDPISVETNFDFTTVQIEYTSPDGTRYSSRNGFQTSDLAFFQVTELSDFDINENGQKTKKLNIEFSCTLYSPTDSIQITEARAVIAIAYP